MRNLRTIPPEKVEKEMNNLIGWYEENKNKIHPLRLATGFHARFEAIHPFEDGNGRTGRILDEHPKTECRFSLVNIHEGKEQMRYYKMVQRKMKTETEIREEGGNKIKMVN